MVACFGPGLAPAGITELDERGDLDAAIANSPLSTESFDHMADGAGIRDYTFDNVAIGTISESNGTREGRDGSGKRNGNR